jgi:hypothetical protein
MKKCYSKIKGNSTISIIKNDRILTLTSVDMSYLSKDYIDNYRYNDFFHFGIISNSGYWTYNLLKDYFSIYNFKKLNKINDNDKLYIFSESCIRKIKIVEIT